MNSLRVCLVVENSVDVRMVEGLAERFALTVVGKASEQGGAITHPPSRPVATVPGPSGRNAYARFIHSYLRQQRDNFDSVIVQGYGMSALAANIAGRVTRTPVSMLVCSPMEAYYRCRKVQPTPGKPFRRSELWLFGLIARANARLGGPYIVLSRYLADTVRAHGGRKPIHLIPIYGVDTDVYAPSPLPKSELKSHLELPTSGALLFFSSRMAPEKDSTTLLAAFKSLLDHGDNLWLLNRSGGYRAIQQEAERFGVAARVIATDADHPHKKLPLSYQAADLCIQASREEGLGFSPLEALACGVPVIATAVGGLKETIREGETGWTYPVGDAQALARSIRAALSDPAEAARRAAAGRRLVIAEYEKQLVFGRLEEVLRPGKQAQEPPAPLQRTGTG